MGIFTRASRVVRSVVNFWIDKAEDPEMMSEQAIKELKARGIELNKAAATIIGARKNTEAQIRETEAKVEKWHNFAHAAMQSDEPDKLQLAEDALVRKKTYSDELEVLKLTLESQTKREQSLLERTRNYESKLREAESRKARLIAMDLANKAERGIQGIDGDVSLAEDSAASTLNRLESRVMNEARQLEAVQEISGKKLENRFAALQKGSVRSELKELQELYEPKAELPASNTESVEADSQDDESGLDKAVLEELRKLD